MNLFKIQKQNNGCRQQTYGYQGIKGGIGRNWEAGVDIHTVLYMKLVTGQNLLYSTRNPTQYSVKTYMGKESKNKNKKSAYMYMYN